MDKQTNSNNGLTGIVYHNYLLGAQKLDSPGSRGFLETQSSYVLALAGLICGLTQTAVGDILYNA